MAAGHFLIFRLAFDEEFERRFLSYQEQAKQHLLSDNQEFVSTMSGIIELDPEAVEKTGYGEKWKQRLDIIEEMNAERDKVEGKIYMVYILLIASVLSSSIAFLIPDGLPIISGYIFYVTSISWWLQIFALLMMLYLLLQQYLLERHLSDPKYVEKREGIKITPPDENTIGRFIRRIVDIF
jgi:hypothetical protein